MWTDFDGKPYTREQFQKMVDEIPAANLRWVKFLTVHNTASPSIAQWLGPTPAAQRILNLQNYYEKQLGWRSGPHGFIPPHRDICIWGFTPFRVKGVHASCFNNVSIGLEMVGDFEREDFNSGDGALVRDNTIFVLAVLYNKLGLRPDGYVYGVSGLHLHHDCKRDNHACPGKKMRDGREAFVRAVIVKMEELKPKAISPDIPVASSPAVGGAVGVAASELPPAAVAKAASPTGAGLMSTITTTTASAAALNALAEQGSRLAEFIRTVKQRFWKTAVTTAATAGAAGGLVDTSKGNGATFVEWAQAHPVAFGCIMGGGIGLLVGGLLIWIFAKRAEKWILTAYKDGRYAPREA